MRKPTISHKYLRNTINEMLELMEDTPEETLKRFEAELKHSCLIIAGDVKRNRIDISTIKCDGETFGLLFTDMDEFRKVFPDYKMESHESGFKTYLKMLQNSNLDGFIINIKSECFILPANLFEENEDLPEDNYSIEDSYTSAELKQLKDQINNNSLEEFIQNPQNIGKYEELFDKMSKSTLLTLMVSNDDLTSKAENGVISMVDLKPLGSLYVDGVGGEYATVYTSEEKISNIKTPMNKYSQIVNFSQMANFILNDDMDGIIINPHDENILLTRDVLLRYYNLLERTCNDSRLNSAIFHMFLMEG